MNDRRGLVDRVHFLPARNRWRAGELGDSRGQWDGVAERANLLENVWFLLPEDVCFLLPRAADAVGVGNVLVGINGHGDVEPQP